MNSTAKKILLILLTVILVCELAFVGVKVLEQGEETVPTQLPSEQPDEEPTGEPTEQPAEQPTEEPTEEPTGEPTEPAEQRFVLTFTGDCTLGSTPDNWNNKNHFVQTVGENYDWPFANLRTYFENDDFTMINLEGVLADDGKAASKRFAFRGPTAYTQILTGSSVEAVTLANNHTEDYGKNGYASTTKALTDAGIGYVEKDNIALYTTESGLKIGLYAASFEFSNADIKNDIAKLKSQGAELIICAMHWGMEGEYRPRAVHQQIAKAAIDAGADIIYGHHPHVLQKIETYNDGIIYYSMGNCAFGGAVIPQDFDTAIVQQEVIRDKDGRIRLGELTIIPCSVTSMSKHQNNFQPTPLKEGSEAYNRVLSKLDGSFKGPNLIVDYSKLDPTTPPATEAPETQAPETQAPETQAPETQAPETQAPETQAPEKPAPETPAPETPAPETPAPDAGGGED